MLNPFPQMPPVILPEEIPLVMPRPKFHIGESVRWRMVIEPDFGRVVGVIFSYEATHQIPGLHYLILLDPRSPSSKFCLYDFAFEEDLERSPHESTGCES